ncbi:MAG: peptide chain release factor N(5)-glutamine methyltransferase [Clostridia bacterium]|nr:peptide chain release factor N(5)-glutamine methyltransferase [Clostridia bacterium]
MTLRQALTDAEPRLDAEWILAHVLGKKRLTMLLSLDDPLCGDAELAFRAMLRRRINGEPLQYILREAHFMGYAFYVDERVLIPRADTETVCEAAIARLSRDGRLLDIGTGSGAIAISAALARGTARVTGVDVSREALAVARINAARLGARVEWLCGDLYESIGGRMFDCIVSNPPYIPSAELRTLPIEVRREPVSALDGGTDGLRYHRAIIAGLPAHLRSGGSLVLESGDGQSDRIATLMKGFRDISILRDMGGLPRAVIGDRYAG